MLLRGRWLHFDDAAKVLTVKINFRAGKDRANLKPAVAADLDALIVKLPPARLCEILKRTQINVV